MAVYGIGPLAGASRAEAFTGENLVVTGSPPEITGPAQTILTNPTFIEEVAVEVGESGGSAAEKSGLARLLSGSGVLPRLGKVLPWVGGAVGAYEICNSFISDGCFLFGGGGESDPTPDAGITWVFNTFMENKGGGRIVPAGVYYSSNKWTWSGDVPEGCSTSGLSAFPGSATGGSNIVSEACNAPGVGLLPLPTRYALRAEGTNRSITATSDTGVSNYSGPGYCPSSPATSGGSVGSCASSPLSNWPARLAQALANPEREGLTVGERDRLGQRIAAEISGAIPNPYAPAQVTIPNCDGLLYPACVDLLEELGLEPVRDARTWTTADIEKPGQAVINVPNQGATVDPGTEVVVVTNPDEEGMPLIVPAIAPNETYDEYAARMVPGLEAVRVDLTEATADISLGPNAAVRTNPAGGSRLDPTQGHEVNVQTNPPTVPPVDAGGGTCTHPSPAIDLSPLNQPIGEKFPFAAFSWAVDGLGSWNVSGSAPSIGIPIHGEDLVFDLGTFEPAMVVIRPVVFICAAIGAVYMLALSMMGLGAAPPMGSDD